MKASDALVMVLLAVVGLAVVAVLVSTNANTSNVITAGATGFSNILKATLAPVSGA